MAGLTAPVLFTEASIDIAPSLKPVEIPTEPKSFFSRKRKRDSSERDEQTYTRQNLATESSIFFRHKNRFPRVFLWRVLDDRKTLQIQSVDLVQDRKNQSESTSTYILTFAQPIRPNGVAFADPEIDALSIFVLTDELFTFTLSQSVLRSSTASFDPAACFKSFGSSSFSFRRPYKLVAASALELLVSLHDGGLLRLQRKAGEDGSTWRETSFSEAGWGSSFKSLIPWKGHSTIPFEDLDLEPATAAAIAASPDGEHVFTVTLDHNLKAWNTKTGKIGVQTDLLGHEEPQPYQIDPHRTALLQVLEVPGKKDGDLYYVVTYSPKDHQFKFWGVRDGDSTTYGFRDVQPASRLIPPCDELMRTTMWQLADFHIKPGKAWKDTQIWLRVFSGATSRIFTLTFDLLTSEDDLDDAWHNKWTIVDDGSSSVSHLAQSLDFPRQMDGPVSAVDATSEADRWISFLFFPGRFSPALLESALYIYRKDSDSLSAPRSTGQSLKERLCSAIAAKVSVRHDSRGHPDLTRYQADMSSQWSVFFGLVRHLQDRRGESLSLAFDNETDLAWSVHADYFGPIRECSEMEVFRHNENIFQNQDEDWIHNSLPLADALADEASVQVARLVSAARTFRDGLSTNFSHDFIRLAKLHALRHQLGTEIDSQNRLQDLYAGSGLESEVSDDDFNRLTDAVQELGGLGELENDIFAAALQRLGEATRGKETHNILTWSGDKLTIRGSQETLQLGVEVLVDLLTLIVFMSQDLEADELAAGFDADELYPDIVARLKEHEVLLWLASHVREEYTRHGDDPDADQAPQSITLFESMFMGDWQGMSFPNEELSSLITYWCRAWTFGLNLATQYDGCTAHVFANLIKHGDHRLALEFVKFLPTGDWINYLKGRLYLAEGELSYAEEYFKRASTTLSQKTGPKIETLDTASLLQTTTRTSFRDGLPRYFLHISSLFEGQKLLSFAADFAALALEHWESESEEDGDASIVEIDRKKKQPDSPAAVRVDLAMEEIRLLKVQDTKEEIVGRLFNASLQTGRYGQAFEALVKFGNPALRRASLQSLLQTLLTSNSVSTLMALDFPPDLIIEVDAILLSLAKKHLDSGVPAVGNTPQYSSILYAWRIQQGNFRGAAEILWQQVESLRSVTPKHFDPDDESLPDAYLVLINTLACCGQDEAWILCEPKHEVAGPFSRKQDEGVGKSLRRRVVTLDDVRREYQAELDRRSEMMQGRFAIVDAMEM